MLSIIIVNYNGMRFLERCFASIYAQNRSDYELVLVDNGSADGSVDFVRKRFPKAVVLELGENTGFAAGNNKGIEVAKGKYILTLNNDTELQKGFLENILSAAEGSDERVGMWAPKILSMEDGKTIDSVGGLLIYGDGLAKGRGRNEKDTGQFDDKIEIFIPSACCALYKKAMLDDIGLFDEDFFAYCEDTDMGLRAKLRGWKAISVPSAAVYHYYSGTGGRYSEFKAFLVERNRFWVAYKNFPLPLLLASFFLVSWRYMAQLLALFRGRGAGARLAVDVPVFRLPWIAVKANLIALLGLSRMISKRNFIQRRRIATYSEINGWFKDFGISAKDIAAKD